MSDSYKTVPEGDSEEDLSLIDGQLMVTASSGRIDESTSLDLLYDSTASTDKESLDFLAPGPRTMDTISRAIMLGGKEQIMDVRDHKRKLHNLRKVADRLHRTEWQYEPIFKLLGD